MTTISINDIPLEPTPLGGNARLLVGSPQLRLVNLILAPGERVLAHTAPVEVVFYVLDGKGAVIAAHERYEIKPGQIFTCPAEVERELQAAPDTGLNLLVVRAPNL